jgi:type II secretory pathway pseudopilin PulG
MIVVSIIALLVVIALPSFLRARQQAQNAKFVNVLRVATGAFELYAMENNGYPAEAASGVVPSGMQNYFGPTLDWTASTPIGGSWDWDVGVFGVTAAISVVGSPASTQQMTDIDTKIDDGNLATGNFQEKSGGTRYSSILH